MKLVRSIKGLFPEWVLATMLLVMWALSVSAISWGLPDSRGWAPDELVPSRVLDGLSRGFADGWATPYPPLHFYLLAFVLLPFQIMAHMGLADLSTPETSHTMFLVLRSVSLILGAATLYLVYLCGRALHGSRAAGIGSAVLVGSMPVFIHYANLANVDVPYTFWLTLSLLCYIRFVQRRHTSALYGFAVTAALAICTKDQAYGFYAPPALHILWLRWRTAGIEPRRVPWKDLHLVGAFASSVLVFVVVHNFLFNYEGFLAHLGFFGQRNPPQYNYSLGGHLRMARDTVWLLGSFMGWPALAICLAGIAVTVRSGRHGTAWFLLPVASYYLFFLSVVLYVYDRFLIGIAVIFAVYGGAALARLAASGRGVLVRRTLCVLVLGYGLVYGSAPGWLMHYDSRYIVEQWARANIAPSQTIGVVNLREYLPRFPDHRGMRLDASWPAAQAQRPGFLVINETLASIRSLESAEDASFYRQLHDPTNGLYEQVLTYRTTPWWASLTPEWVFWSPHDVYSNLAKINPEIHVYRRLSAPSRVRPQRFEAEQMVPLSTADETTRLDARASNHQARANHPARDDGFVVLGPWIDLEPGPYRVEVSLRLAVPTDAQHAARVDVTASRARQAIIAREIPTSGLSSDGTYATVAVSFETTEVLHDVEFRVNANPNIELLVDYVDLIPILP